MTSKRAPHEIKAQESHAVRRRVEPKHKPELAAHQLANLQRTLGNQTLHRLLTQGDLQIGGNPVQAKLTVGAPNDVYEQEADQVAHQVMTMPDTAVQREEFTTEDEELAQTMPISRVQREELPEEDDLAQAKFIQREPDEWTQMKSAGDVPEVTDDIESIIQTARGSGNAMPDSAREFFEPRFGHDFSGVNIHTGGEADQLNNQLQARAFTTGNDIFFRSGEYNPDSSSGRELLAHELTHVVQQDASKVLRQHERIAREPQDAGVSSGATTSSTPTKSEQVNRPKKIKVWFHSFIPQAKIPGPPTTEDFQGDNRSASNAIHASYRTHQELEFDVDTLAISINWKDTGVTHELDSKTGAVLKSGKASPSELITNGPLRTPDGKLIVHFRGSATNPLFILAPAIDYDVIFEIDPLTRECKLTGEHDGFPGYEAYITAEGGSGNQIYSYDPISADEGILALGGGMDKVATGSISF